jgi:hypothetical protein
MVGLGAERSGVLRGPRMSPPVRVRQPTGRLRRRPEVQRRLAGRHPARGRTRVRLGRAANRPTGRPVLEDQAADPRDIATPIGRVIGRPRIAVGLGAQHSGVLRVRRMNLRARVQDPTGGRVQCLPAELLPADRRLEPASTQARLRGAASRRTGRAALEDQAADSPVTVTPTGRVIARQQTAVGPVVKRSGGLHVERVSPRGCVRDPIGARLRSPRVAALRPAGRCTAFTAPRGTAPPNQQGPTTEAARQGPIGTLLLPMPARRLVLSGRVRGRRFGATPRGPHLRLDRPNGQGSAGFRAILAPARGVEESDRSLPEFLAHPRPLPVPIVHLRPRAAPLARPGLRTIGRGGRGQDLGRTCVGPRRIGHPRDRSLRNRFPKLRQSFSRELMRPRSRSKS